MDPSGKEPETARATVIENRGSFWWLLPRSPKKDGLSRFQFSRLWRVISERPLRHPVRSRFHWDHFEGCQFELRSDSELCNPQLGKHQRPKFKWYPNSATQIVCETSCNRNHGVFPFVQIEVFLLTTAGLSLLWTTSLTPRAAHLWLSWGEKFKFSDN